MKLHKLDWQIVVPVVGGVLFGFILAACTLGLGSPEVDRAAPPAVSTSAAGVAGDPGAEEARRIATIEEVTPSVVSIATKSIERRFFGGNPLEVPQGTGSGFIWDADGHVVTNFHVIMSADVAVVKLSDDTTYNARLVGAYPEKDIAVLKIDAPREKLVPIRRGESEPLRRGQNVLAIGSPFGYDHTVTTGIVSALGREILSVAKTIIIDVIQTDAAINPGNSGGPLLDSLGRVIGVNVAIFSPSQTSAGIGFAIPIDIVKKIVGQLIEFGEIRQAIHPVLGIQTFDDRQVARAGLRGVVIHKVFPDSGAARAGLREYEESDGRETYDIIVEVDGNKIQRLADLTYVLEKRKAGDEVEVVVVRDRKVIKTKVRLGAP